MSNTGLQLHVIKLYIPWGLHHIVWPATLLGTSFGNSFSTLILLVPAGPTGHHCQNPVHSWASPVWSGKPYSPTAFWQRHCIISSIFVSVGCNTSWLYACCYWAVPDKKCVISANAMYLFVSIAVSACCTRLLSDVIVRCHIALLFCRSLSRRPTSTARGSSYQTSQRRLLSRRRGLSQSHPKTHVAVLQAMSMAFKAFQACPDLAEAADVRKCSNSLICQRIRAAMGGD